MFLLSLIFSWLGISLITAGLVAAAVTSAFLRLPRWVTIAFAVAAAVHIYSGTVYRAGVSAERERVVAEIAKEQTRQKRETGLAIDELQKALTESEAGETSAEATAAALQAIIASRPPVAGRGATQDDVNALSR